MIAWLRKRAFRVHLASFMLTVLASALLYFAAQAGSTLFIVLLIALIVFGNLLVMLVP